MDEQKNYFEELRTKLESYIQNRILLIKLQVVEKISRLAAGMFAGLMIMILSFFVLLFISIMAAYYLAGLAGSNFIGFGIVAGFYVLLLVLIIVFRKNVIEKRIINMIIEVFFDKNEDKHEA